MGAHSERIRIGVVGVGYWGSKHLRVLRSTTGVVTVVGVDQRFTGIDGIPKHLDFDVVGYTDIEQVLPDVDAVVIATPPSTHARLSMQAVEAGNHVLVEKPLATTTAEAQRVVDAAESAGLVLMAGHTLEHNATVHKLRDFVRSKEFGDLYYLDCAPQPRSLPTRRRRDHEPRPARHLGRELRARLPAHRRHRLGSQHVHPEYEDVAHLLLEYGDLGIRASFHVSWLSPQKVRRVTAVGSKKMAVYDDLTAERIRVYHKAAVPPEGEDGPLSRVAYRLGDMVAPFVAFAEPLAVQDQNFVDCITDGSRPTADGNSGLGVIQVLECAQISLREQRPVELAEVMQQATVPAQRIRLND